MKTFTVITTMIKGYSGEYDEYNTEEMHTILIPSRNNKMRENIADLLMEFIDNRNNDRHGCYEESRSHQTMSYEYKSKVYSCGGMCVGGEPYILREKKFGYRDGGSSHLLVFAYDIEQQANNQADKTNLYQYMLNGTSPYVGDGSRYAELLDTLQRRFNYIPVYEIAGLETFCLPGYDYRSVDREPIPKIQFVSKSVEPMIEQIPVWIKKTGENIINQAYGESETFENIFGEPRFKQGGFSNMEMRRVFNRFEINHDELGMYGWVKLTKYFVFGIGKNWTEQPNE